LKDSGKSIREDLTHHNAKLLSVALDYKDKVESVWSHEGKIIALLKDNRKIALHSIEELNKVAIEIPPPGSKALTIGKTTRFSTPKGTSGLVTIF
jgi:hypothetical protein